MFPSPNNPSVDASMRLSDEQPSSANHMPHTMMMLSEAIDISENNQYHQQYRNDWGDANGQVDYFASFGFNNDSIYNAATSESWSISPLTRSRPANYVTQQRSYPSQDLNPHYEGLQLSSSSPSGMSIDGSSSMKAPESVPLPPPLPPVSGGAPSQSGKFRADEVASMSTGYPCNNEVDPFELGAGTVAAPSHPPTFVTKTPDGEWRGDDYKNNNVTDAVIGGATTTKVVASRVSTSPSPKIAARAATTKPTRKKKATKGVPSSAKKSSGGGIKTPSEADILRGRGGLTNRHKGNMKFRDEARKLRGNYRDKDCTRQEKFILSQQLSNRVKEYGGRFLEKKKGSDLWFEISDKDARKKCSQVLREEKWD